MKTTIIATALILSIAINAAIFQHHHFTDKRIIAEKAAQVEKKK